MSNNTIGNNFIPSMTQVSELRLATDKEASPVLTPKSVGPLTAQESHLVDVKNRLDGMLKNSVSQSGGISLLDKALIPLPDDLDTQSTEVIQLYSALFKQHVQIKEHMNALNQIPLQQFKDDTGNDEALHELIDKTAEAYQNMEELGQKLYSAYVKSGQNPPTLCDELEYACPARMSELYTAATELRMLGEVERGVIKPEDAEYFQNFQKFETEGRNFTSIMSGLATNMHGMSEAMSSVTGQAEKLFDTIDKLETNYQTLTSKQLNKAIDSTRKDLVQLEKQVAKADIGSTELSALRQGLKTAEQRLNLLLAPDCKGAIIKKITGLFGENLPVPLAQIISDKALASKIERIDENIRALDDIKAELLTHAKNGTLTASIITQAETRITPLQNTVWGLIRLEDNLKTPLENHFFGVPQQVRTGAFDELKSLCRSAVDKQMWSPHEVALAVMSANPKAELEVLLEVGLRGGAMRNHVDMEAIDSNLTHEKQLGAGAMNTVQLLTYKNAQGEEIKRVFKAEYPIQNLLNGAGSSNRLRMFSKNTRVAGLNVASNLVAEKMGHPDIIAKSKVGVHSGNYGILMEFKPGREASKARFEILDDIKSMSPKTVDMAVGNLHRSVCNLEWADALSGQTDRHRDNYLVNFNKSTCEANLTGIDNDTSFGQVMLGPGLMRLTPEATRCLTPAELRDRNVIVKNNGISCVDITKVGRTSQLQLRGTFFLNQMIKPQYIDRKTYDTLHAIDETAYRADLSKVFADKDQIDSAVIRLRASKAHAEALATDNKVIDNWQDHNLTKQAAAEYGNMLANINGGAQVSGTNFFARDFGELAKYCVDTLWKQP